MKKIPEDYFIDIEPPSRKGLSFCQVNLKSLAEWIEKIPITDHLGASQRLLSAISELSNLKVPISLRIDMIDRIAPTLLLCAHQLQKTYLNKPTVLPHQEQRNARLYDALLNKLIQAYLSVLKECQLRMSSLFNKPLAPLIRAMIGALSALRNYQINTYLLYQYQSKGFYLHVHKIYKTAIFLSINKKTISLDSDYHVRDIENLYAEIVLWKVSNPQQLSQNDMLLLAKILTNSRGLIGIKRYAEAANDTVAFTTQGDDITTVQQQPNHSLFDLMLSYPQLKAQILGESHDEIHGHIYNHILSNLSQAKERRFTRNKVNSELYISLGISACHYFIRRNITFHDLVFGTVTPDMAEYNEDTRMGHACFTSEYEADQSIIDVWDASFIIKNPPNRSSQLDESVKNNNKKLHTSIPVKTLNSSAGGYCLQLSCNNSVILRAGDLVAIKSKVGEQWNLATIRWIQHIETQSYQMGIELISPSPIAFGAHIKHSQNYMRAFLLPATTLCNASVILPSINLKYKQTIEFIKNNQRFRIKLKDKIRATSVFSQYNFDYSSDTTQNTIKKKKDTKTSLSLMPDSEHF